MDRALRVRKGGTSPLPFAPIGRVPRSAGNLVLKQREDPMRQPGSIRNLGLEMLQRYDGRFWGPLRREAIVGKVLYRCWGL